MEKKKRLITYIGNDQSYWKIIQGRIVESYFHLKLEYNNFFPTLPSETQSLVLTILKEMPRIIYIDYSVRLEEHIMLTNLLKRDNILKNIAICGLVESKSNVKGCIAAGADFIHVKCGEYNDVVFDPFYLAFTKSVKQKIFAKAQTSDRVLLSDDCRIGFVTPTHLHVETNLEFEIGDTIIFDTQLPAKNMKSKKFYVENVEQENIYYDYAFAIELKIIFVDEPNLDSKAFTDALAEQDPKLKVKKLKAAKFLKQENLAQYESDLKRCKKNHRAWVLDNISVQSPPKLTKILIVDRFLRIFKDKQIQALDKYPFIIRAQTILDENLRDIYSILPNVIAIQLFSDVFDPGSENENLLEAWSYYLKIAGKSPEEISALELDTLNPLVEAELDLIRMAEHDEMGRIEDIIRKLKTLDDYHPFLVLYNCSFITSKALQETYLYPMITVKSEPISLTSLLGISSKIETKQKAKYDQKIKTKILQLRKKDPRKFGRLTPLDFEEKKFFLKKTDPLSYVSHSKKVILDSITESEIVISSDKKIELRTYNLSFPIEMAIKLVPTKDGKIFIENKGRFFYKGLIHSVGEMEKKQLRRFINEVIGAPMREEQEKELQDFKDKHDQIKENGGDDTIGDDDDIER